MSYSPELLASALKMLAALTVVLAGLFVFALITKRYVGGRGATPHNRLIRLVANTPLGMKKSIALVEIPGAILVVGISSDNICLLSQIEDKSIVEQMTASGNRGPALPFAAYLQKFSARFVGSGDHRES